MLVFELVKIMRSNYVKNDSYDNDDKNDDEKDEDDCNVDEMASAASRATKESIILPL